MNRSDRYVEDWRATAAGYDGEVAAWPPADVPDDPPEPMPLDRERLVPTGFVEWFVVAQTAIPALLYLPGSQAFRLPIRVGAYVITLCGFVLWILYRRGERDAHPAQRWLLVVTLCMAIMILHPLTNAVEAGVAQTLLYFAIFCPLFWVPGFVDRPRQLVRILAILLICNGINSLVGVLQVYDPDTFMPKELSFAYGRNSNALAAATYVGPDGRLIVRPPGLFDTPGAVCGPGTISALLGLVFAMQPFAWWKRLAALGMSVAGVAAIFLSHVRANLVVTIIMMATYAGLLMLVGERKRLTAFAGLCGALLLAGLTAATALGGESIAERFATLLEEDPRGVYYASRGLQIEYGFNHLAVQYPAGAGLGRWGMMRGYFGDPANLDSTELWAEVQPNAWILDGGWPLLLLYAGALAVTVVRGTTLVRRLRGGDNQSWAATVVAVSIGTIALVFSFVPFATQVGLQFWFLEGALHGALGSQQQE